jgi:hypothetical protein
MGAPARRDGIGEHRQTPNRGGLEFPDCPVQAMESITSIRLDRNLDRKMGKLARISADHHGRRVLEQRQKSLSPGTFVDVGGLPQIVDHRRSFGLITRRSWVRIPLPLPGKRAAQEGGSFFGLKAQGRSSNAGTCLGRTTEKCRRSSVATVTTRNRSAAAMTEASAVPSGRFR